MITEEVLAKINNSRDRLINHLNVINETVDYYSSQIDKINKGIYSMRCIENQAKKPIDQFDYYCKTVESAGYQRGN